MRDLYRPLLARALFPAYEAARGRPTVPLLRYLRETERRSLGELRELQLDLLRRLVRHAYQHTPYRAVLDARGLAPEDFGTLDDLRRLPLDRAERHHAESRHWRDAIRWRAYGWGGYEIGMRALHYWAPGTANWWQQKKSAVDHLLKRDLYLDCTSRSAAALDGVVAELKRFRPHVIVAYPSAGAALARHINARGLRSWSTIPVLTGAERLLPLDRAAMERAFGPTFDTYSRRAIMIGAECEQHDGLHTSMETLIVELLVRAPDGSMRPARPGEAGEVVITDLHSLASPMIRYATGDVAVARDDTPCPCGRGLEKLGPIESPT